MPLRLWILPLAALATGAVASCGARTALLVQDAGPPPVTFDSGACTELPWLLFDIVYDTGTPTAGIYAMRADGSSGHMVTLPHGPAFFPRVSPDGSKLLYATALPLDAQVDG